MCVSHLHVLTEGRFIRNCNIRMSVARRGKVKNITTRIKHFSLGNRDQNRWKIGITFIIDFYLGTYYNQDINKDESS